MNFFIKCLNFLGVLVLAILCIYQWKSNSRLTAECYSLQKTIRDDAETISTQTNILKENDADLNDFRQRLILAETQLTKTQAERDQLKTTSERLIIAVNARDRVLKDQADSIHKLVEARNDAIAKFNDLVAKYNALIFKDN